MKKNSTRRMFLDNGYKVTGDERKRKKKMIGTVTAGPLSDLIDEVVNTKL